jgi:hypothetical protein
MFYRTIAPRIQVDRLLRIAYNDLQADYDEGFTTGGNAAPPTACGSPVTGAVLRPRVDRPIPIVVAEVPRFPRNDPLAAASTAHQSSVHKRSHAATRLLVLMAIASKSGAELLHLG